MGIGTTELIIILIVIVVIFGAGKLGGVGKALGKSVREFKEEMHTDEETSTEEVKEEK